MSRLLSFSLTLLLIFEVNANEVEEKLLSLVSESELKTIQNLPPELQERILNNLQNNNVDDDDAETTFNVTEDTVININDPVSDRQRFGYSFFSGIPTTYTPINDVPVPSDYILGIGDVIQINFRGQKSGSYDLNVNKSGQIYIPEIGEVSVQGLKFEEAQEKIKQIFKSFYISVEPSITLKELKFIQVTVLGAVKNPGSYLVNPFTSASNLLSFAGGLEEYASLRNIEIRGDEVFKIDLYELLIEGIKTDLNLRSGDVVYVPTTSNFIYVNGAVNRPAFYEYVDKDDINNLIKFAQGTTRFANNNNLQIKIFDGTNIVSEVYEDLEAIESLNNIIELFVPEIIPNFLDNIYVYGDVANPGPFELEKFDSLEKLINSLSFTNDLYPFFAILENTSDSTQKNEFFAFSIYDKKTMKGLKLQPGSKVYLFHKSYFLFSENYPVEIPSAAQRIIDGYSLSFNGEFLNNAVMPVYGQARLMDLINYIGGFAPTADKTRLEVIFPLEVKTLTNPDPDFLLDTPLSVSVNAPKFNSEIIKVSIQGEVNNPGIYPILSGTTLSQIYDKAGRFKNTASADSVILLREELRNKEIAALEVAKSTLTDALLEALSNASVANAKTNTSPLIGLLGDAFSIEPKGRLSGDLSPSSDFSNSLLLQDGDVIIIPQMPQTITIFGEVNNQVTLNYSEELSFNDYINLAGGFKSSADKSKIFVIKSNGTSFSLNRGLFDSASTKLLPGDTIIVPKDLDKISGLPLVEAATNILSSLAFSAASLNAIRN